MDTFKFQINNPKLFFFTSKKMWYLYEVKDEDKLDKSKSEKHHPDEPLQLLTKVRKQRKRRISHVR